MHKLRLIFIWDEQNSCKFWWIGCITMTIKPNIDQYHHQQQQWNTMDNHHSPLHQHHSQVSSPVPLAKPSNLTVATSILSSSNRFSISSAWTSPSPPLSSSSPSPIHHYHHHQTGGTRSSIRPSLSLATCLHRRRANQVVPSRPPSCWLCKTR